MKRLVIVGASFRCYTMFVENLLDNFPNIAEIVGVYDVNKVRCEVFKKRVGDGLTIYDDFDKMLDTEKPDAVIVTTIDKFHHEYIIRALNKGYDVFSEKPITTNYENCLAIREAEKKSGKKVTVTFNCRTIPVFEQIKKILKTNKLGKIYSINYEYFLNRWHGGDYFKRWHRLMENSGGMLVHKSTHHFDIINWLLEDTPEKVSALGNQIFYNNKDKSFAKRCSECPNSANCESYKSQTAEMDIELYFKAETQDGYVRDRCCYLADSDIYDNMSVSVMYNKGTLLTYSLNLFSARGAGYHLSITGENGTLLLDVNIPEEVPSNENFIKVYLKNGITETYAVPKKDGRHGGGDTVLIGKLFGVDTTDELDQCADSFAGVTSAMIGICANESIKTGKMIDIGERLNKLK